MCRNWSFLVGVLMFDSNDMSMKDVRLGVGEGVRLDGEGMDIWGGDWDLGPRVSSVASVSPLVTISLTLSVAAVESGMMVIVVESMSATSTIGRGTMLTTC